MHQIIQETVNQSTGRRFGTRGYANSEDRRRAIRGLARHGCNHFVCYFDTQSEFALQYGWASWCEGNGIYVAW